MIEDRKYPASQKVIVVLGYDGSEWQKFFEV
jgi:hypothetical protein